MSLWFARTVRLAICCKWLPLSIFCYADSSMSMASTRCAEFFESIFAFNLKIYGLSVFVCVVFGLFDKQKLSFHIKKKEIFENHLDGVHSNAMACLHFSLNIKMTSPLFFKSKCPNSQVKFRLWFLCKIHMVFFLALLNWFPEFINKINMKYMRKHMWL